MEIMFLLNRKRIFFFFVIFLLCGALLFDISFLTKESLTPSEYQNFSKNLLGVYKECLESSQKLSTQSGWLTESERLRGLSKCNELATSLAQSTTSVTVSVPTSAPAPTQVKPSGGDSFFGFNRVEK
jgi:hypothetical protein